jgi:two-component system, LytTR family, sensor kinase
MHILTRIKFVVLGWAAATLFFTTILLVSDVGTHNPPFFAFSSTAIHFALWALALPLLSWCTRTFPLGRGKRIRNGAVLLVMAATLGSAVMLAQWAIVYATCFPYRSQYPTFGLLLQSEIQRFLPADILIGIVIVLAFEGWRVWLDFQAERTRAGDLERQLAVSRLDALRMQLHPHFLFNTLHTITGLIAEQPATARRMVISLGDLLRFTLNDTSEPFRSLAEELEFADLYLGIEKLRLGDRLILDYDIDSEASAAQVPQLLLQPLFENAIRHGVSRMPEACRVRFCAQRDGDQLHLRLSNDGLLRSQSSPPPTFGVGLTNTMVRLRLHYQDRFTFQYSDRPQGGAQIDLWIPYEKMEAKTSVARRPEEVYAGNTNRAHAGIDRG